MSTIITDVTKTFSTPAPLEVDFDLQAARLDLVASERNDTVVTIAPRNPNRKGDVEAVQGTTVEFANNRLTIVAPKGWKIIGPSDSLVVTIELPTGSTIGGKIAYGNVRGTGRLADTRIKSSYGDLAFDEIAAAELHTSYGDVSVGAATGDVDLTSSYGGIRVDLIEGSATVKTSYGEISIGEVTGTLQASANTGGIRVDYAGSETNAKIAYGNIKIGEAAEGSVRLEGSGGDLEVGVPEGTAAWLDLNSAKGFVRNELTAESAPAPGDKTVEVRARVTWGDIVISRPVNRRPGERRTPKTPKK
jgi:DUF4097 and DUF4098 domain-containing protein YvlB